MPVLTYACLFPGLDPVTGYKVRGVAMTGKEFKQCRQEIRDILNLRKTSSEREAKLKALAPKVGASTLSRYHAGGALEPELVDNINDALRTESMIRTCKTASKHFLITIIAAIASVISMLAAWTAILFRLW